MPLNLHELAAEGHADTFAAVTLGAIVATVSGVVANVWEARVRERQRERAAALLIGETIATLHTILENALNSMQVGERFGVITRRMLFAARREVDIYDRNREMLMDLRDADLRADVHSLMVRLAMPLDGVLASFEGAAAVSDPGAIELGIQFIAENLDERFPSILERLARLAGQSFESRAAIFSPADRPPRPS